MHPLLQHVSHRPYPVEHRPWIMAQTWHDLLFAHWPLSPEVIAPLIPKHLELETFQGQAWIAVVPFHMSGIRFRGTPPVPGTSAFPELNVRTYVRPRKKENPERPGVYFFSLDATNWLAVRVARIWFHLNYLDARMSWRNEAGVIHYESSRFARGAPKAEFQAMYKPIGEEFRSQPGTLEYWLTERYCLYAADTSDHLYRGEIHHEPWPLHHAQAEIQRNSMVNCWGMQLPEYPPHLLFSKRISVICWAPLRLKV